jgi:phosphate transport system substrate-binding protein
MMKKSLLNKLAVFGLALLVSGAIESGLQAAVQLAWTGCGITKKAFMLEAAKAYKAKTGITIKLSGGSSHSRGQVQRLHSKHSFFNGRQRSHHLWNGSHSTDHKG